MQKKNKKKLLKSFLKIAMIFFGALIALYFILNIELTTRKAVNYKVARIKIPLYIKVIEFIDREYQYTRLAKDIVKNETDKEEILKLIFNWVTENIRTDFPESFPIVDDHPFNIIIRGYGTDDQEADVFTILASFYGMDGEWKALKPYGKTSKILITLINLDGREIVFDLKNKNYFLNNEGHLASLNDIEKDISIVEEAAFKPYVKDIPYVEYFRNISSLKETRGFTRARKQFFGDRIKFEFKKALINLMAK